MSEPLVDMLVSRTAKFRLSLYRRSESYPAGYYLQLVEVFPEHQSRGPEAMHLLQPPATLLDCLLLAEKMFRVGEPNWIALAGVAVAALNPVWDFRYTEIEIPLPDLPKPWGPG